MKERKTGQEGINRQNTLDEKTLAPSLSRVATVSVQEQLSRTTGDRTGSVPRLFSVQEEHTGGNLERREQAGGK